MTQQYFSDGAILKVLSVRLSNNGNYLIVSVTRKNKNLPITLLIPTKQVEACLSA